MKQGSLKAYFAVAMTVVVVGCSKSGEPDNVTVSASNGGTAIAVNNGTIVTGVASSASGPNTAVATNDADEIVQSSTGAALQMLSSLEEPQARSFPEAEMPLSSRRVVATHRTLSL